ncbi:MAG: PVC-type heme-binding CxxCH protein [Planctomycetota bacterium]
MTACIKARQATGQYDITFLMLNRILRHRETHCVCLPKEPSRVNKVQTLIVRNCLVLTIGLFSLAQARGQGENTYVPKVEPASSEGTDAIRRIKAPGGLKVSLFAAEPLLANPVTFCTDNRGRFFVAETFRHHAGVTDARDHMYWLDDDLACRTVEDRVNMYRKHLGGLFDTYAREHDRVRRIEDKDGDGIADHSTVLADGFRNAADGIGAGILARGNKIWFTCIPDLWLLEDTDDDGKAETKKSLQTGYGVHVGFLGHDLHGLKMGPDGKLYFSIGDRGLNVVSEGKTFAYPDTGCVLRCDPDGTNLEVFATGLRNPQELAFDEFGNLFTVDNNSDAGDKARLVHLVEGGDSGWRIGYQFITHPTPRGPWNAELLWDPEKAKLARYLLPPLANITDGPSGLAYYPGTGFDDSYKGKFFICDFRGVYGLSGVRSFTVEPRNASFRLKEESKFLWSVLATDIDFGTDSNLYVLDWVDGWNKPGKGRIYRLNDPKRENDPRVKQVQTLLAEGMSDRGEEELRTLLSDSDMRIRQEAQFVLAERGAAALPLLKTVTNDKTHLLARLHAIWAIGQISRNQPTVAAEILIPLLSDEDAEVRAQASKVLGDLRVQEAVTSLIPLCKDSNSRVRFFACMALGKLGDSRGLKPLLAVLRENRDEDAYLRHAAVMGLVGLRDGKLFDAAANDDSPSVRIGVLLALRRLEDPSISRFLKDSDGAVVLEAARAINDVPIPEAFAPLAELANQEGLAEPVLRRALNANYRIGKKENAERIASIALQANVPTSVRVDAAEMLRDWVQPSGRDRIVGVWRPLPRRSVEDPANVLRPVLAAILKDSPEQVRLPAIQAAAAYRIQEAGPILFEIFKQKNPVSVRSEALAALGALDARELSDAIPLALKDKNGGVRTAGYRLLAKTQPAEAVKLLENVLENGETREKQDAFGILADISEPSCDDLLSRWLDRLSNGEVVTEIQLDLLESAGKRKVPLLADKLAAFENARNNGDALAAFRETLSGGDIDDGKKIFFERTEAACLRCHKIQGRGGEVGPDLSHVGSQQNREYLLEAIVAPNNKIAKGFESIVLATSDGSVLTGILKDEDAEKLRVMTAEGAMIEIAKSDIEDRRQGKSAMPDDITKHLSKRDIRNLVAYLISLK